ncbi:hypothetical protein ACLI4Y_00740 [Natrialbaceae archaeon A-CW3]
MSGSRSQATKPRPRGGRPLSSTDRAQAFTLEGFVAAFILLIAVLFAVQSVVITPSTGGAVDRTAQAQLQQQTQDALIIAQQDNDLSEMIRRIELDEDDNFVEFRNETGSAQGNYTMSEFGNESTLGAVLNQNLDAGQRYNVELHYQPTDPDDEPPEPIKLVDQGSPSSTAVTASYTVVLHGNQSITTPGENRTLDEIDEMGGYIPDLNPEDDDELYNVVEVRVVVW